MEIYRDFAYCYDLFMDDIPYGEWTDYITALLRERGIEDGLVCELGCGTGEVTERLADAGYDLIGVDASEDMLMVAREKLSQAEAYSSDDGGSASCEPYPGILYLHQDMRELELYGTVKAFVSVCDSINYLLKSEDLAEVFKRVNNYLDKDGVFIFDLKTVHFYETACGDNTFTEERAEGVLEWKNSYDSESRLNRYSVTVDLFDADENVYDEIREEHIQRAYTLDEVKKALSDAGLVFEAAYEALTKKEPDGSSDRIYVIAREGFQEKKTYV